MLLLSHSKVVHCKKKNCLICIWEANMKKSATDFQENETDFPILKAENVFVHFIGQTFNSYKHVQGLNPLISPRTCSI